MSILQIEDKPNTSPTLIRIGERKEEVKRGDFVYILDITILAVHVDILCTLAKLIISSLISPLSLFAHNMGFIESDFLFSTMYYEWGK